MSDSPAKIVLVGHCGPDSSYLRITVAAAVPGSRVTFANDDTQLQAALRAGVDLVLFNRELDGMFAVETGVEQIQLLKQAYPHVKTMLVSNYPEAQAEAVAAGALPGFGKRQLGSPTVVALLQQALESQETSRASS